MSRLQKEGLTDALIYDMVGSFSNLQRFHKYQVTLDTFYTKEQFEQDDRDGLVKRQEALGRVFNDKLWKVTEGVSVIPRTAQKNNLLNATPTKYRDGSNKEKMKVTQERKPQAGDFIIDSRGFRHLLVYGGRGVRDNSNTNPSFKLTSSGNGKKYSFDYEKHMALSDAKPLISSGQFQWEKNDEGLG